MRFQQVLLSPLLATPETKFSCPAFNRCQPPDAAGAGFKTVRNRMTGESHGKVTTWDKVSTPVDNPTANANTPLRGGVVVVIGLVRFGDKVGGVRDDADRPHARRHRAAA